MSSAMLPPDRIGFSCQLHFFPKTKMSLKSVFTHVASIYANLLEQKRKRQHKKRLQLPQDWFWTPTWPPFKLFWDTNMGSVTSCENTLQSVETFLKQIVPISLFRDNSPRWDGFWIWSYYCLARSDLQMQSIPD